MGDRIQIGVVVRPAREMRTALDRAVALETAGIDVIGVPEAYGTDAVSLLGYLAASTARVRLRAQVLPIYSRSPTLLAMTAAGLDDVSDSRFELGLGASGPQVVEGWHGVPYDAPLGRTREIVDICRATWRRERIEHRGRHYRIPLDDCRGTGLGKPLKLLHHPTRDRIPIHLAALGEKSVALTAEIADGWLPFLFDPERADEVWGDALSRGLAKRDPALEPLAIGAGGPFAVTDDPQPLRDLDRPRLALYLGGMGARGANFYTEVAGRYGYGAEAAQVQDRYLSADTSGAEAAVPERLLESTSLVGDRAYLRDRLQAYAAAGVSVVEAAPIGPDAVRDLAVLRELAEDVTVVPRALPT